jgi:hypothetical protein
MTEDQDFPKLRDSTRPNTEWLQTASLKGQKPNAPDGIAVNIVGTGGGYTKVRTIGEIDEIVSEDGWTGDDTP